jgi:hypothetical protein
MPAALALPASPAAAIRSRMVDGRPLAIVPGRSRRLRPGVRRCSGSGIRACGPEEKGAL